MEKSALEMMRKSWSVGIIAQREIGLGSARVSRAGFGVPPKQSFGKFAIARTRSPARETRALPGRRLRASALLLHYQHERADQRDSENEANALQRPDVIGHERFADPLHRQRFDLQRWNRERFRFQNCPEQSAEHSK